MFLVPRPQPAYYSVAVLSVHHKGRGSVKTCMSLPPTHIYPQSHISGTVGQSLALNIDVCVCEGVVMRSVLPAASQKSEVVGLLFRPVAMASSPGADPSLPGPCLAPLWVGGVERLLQSCSMQRFLPSRSEKSRTKSEGGNGGQSLPHPGTSPLLAGFAPPQTPVFPPSSRSCDSGCRSVSGHNRMAACHP